MNSIRLAELPHVRDHASRCRRAGRSQTEDSGEQASMIS